MAQSDLEWPRAAMEIVWMTQYDFRWVKSTSASLFWGPSDLNISIYSGSVTSQRETTTLCESDKYERQKNPLNLSGHLVLPFTMWTEQLMLMAPIVVLPTLAEAKTDDRWILLKMWAEFCFHYETTNSWLQLTVKLRAVDWSTIQFLSIFGVLLTEGYYIKGLLFNFWTFLGCY